MSVIPARLVAAALAFATGQPAGKVPQTVGDGTFEFIDTPTGGGGGTLPHRVDIGPLPAVGSAENGDWLAEEPISNLWVLSNNSTPANGDWIEWEVVMAAGTWRFDAVVVTAAGGGLVDVTIDGGSVEGTVDMYGTTQDGVEKSVTGITVAADGIHTVRAAINGKNASSSNYIARFQAISLTRTGD